MKKKAKGRGGVSAYREHEYVRLWEFEIPKARTKSVIL